MNAPPMEPPVREGEVLAGKYRVDRVLGQGGMGVVVAATHLELDQRVALKFVLEAATQSPEVIERFKREGKAAARLRSEHVARMLDVGTLANGAPYLVMEYLEGRDLGAEVTARGPLPLAEACELVLQACEGLAEAHAVGIVHRDLKPQNLFLTRRVDGRPLVKVLDFGISKFSGSTSGENMALTKTNAVMGSPNYMAPEQLRSARGTDARTDIWAIGVILYELFTARVPFAATSVTELCAMVLQDQPAPLTEVRPEISPQLAAVVARCLEKDPARRFQSIAQLAAALEPFASSVAHGTAQRVAAVARGSQPRDVGSDFPPPQASQPIAVVSSSSGNVGSTSVAWGDTQLQMPRRHLVAKIAAAAAVALVLLAGGGFAASRLLGGRGGPATGSPTAPPSTAAVDAAPPPTSAPSSATPAPPPPTASAPPPPPPSHAADAAAVPTGKTRAGGTKPPPAAPHPHATPKGEPDTPDDRN